MPCLSLLFEPSKGCKLCWRGAKAGLKTGSFPFFFSLLSTTLLMMMVVVWFGPASYMVCIHSEDTIPFFFHSRKKNNNACTSLPISPLPHHHLTLFGKRIRSFLWREREREKVLQLKMGSM